MSNKKSEIPEKEKHDEGHNEDAHASHSAPKTNHGTTRKGGAGSGAGYVQLILVFIILVLCLIWGIPEYKKQDAQHKKERRELAEKQKSMVQQNSPKREKTLQTFTFKNGAGITMYLEPGWEIYAIGGNISIITPKGKKIDDKPGSTKRVGMQPKGYYTIYPTEKTTQKVQVVNYWNTGSGF